MEEPDFDYEKRDERIRNQRVAALQEIWETQSFDGIRALLSKSGAAFTIGWHMAEGVIATAAAAGFLEQCLKVEHPELSGKFDQAIRGFLLKLYAGVRAEVTKTLMKALQAPFGLPPSQVLFFPARHMVFTADQFRPSAWR